ncbi:hypothetical protein SB02110_04606 [Klebsiella quasipneumoniae subsp. quasipneumoniae]|nr:Uncharacterised protein [Klebsiella pneumoniae]SYL94371.1 Uncharacterised protein [Klebsiella pneumoniae]VGP49560.1 hypothetical protein SB02110_04606 [Klebsiella quasipneumoniae subsp. quasipneumoniae]
MTDHIKKNRKMKQLLIVLKFTMRLEKIILIDASFLLT